MTHLQGSFGTESMQSKLVSVTSQRSLKIAANKHHLFTVEILLFMRALLDQKSYRTTESALGDDETVKSVLARAFLNYMHPR